MKIVFYTTLLLALGATSFASVSRGDYSDPKHPGKCVIEPNLILSPGEHMNTETCGRILCSSNGSAEFHYCGSKLVQIPGCTLGDYLDKSVGYPECCKQKLICPDNPEMDGKLI